MAGHYTFYAKVDRTELTNAIKSIGDANGKARLGVESALKKGVTAIRRDGKRRAPVKSGYLKKSIKSDFKAADLNGYVYSTAPHAHLMEDGVKASYVYPTAGKKALKIVDKRLLRYAAHAKIPARRAHPFLKPAYDANEPKIIDDIKGAIKNL